MTGYVDEVTVTASRHVFDPVQAFKNALMSSGKQLSHAGRAATKHPQYFGFESDQVMRQV